MKVCKPGSYISGMQVRYSDPLPFNDNTALEGLSIICRDPYERSFITETLTVEWGNWGLWREKVKSKFNFVCGVDGQYQKFEESKGKQVDEPDNTGLNGIRVEMCPYV